MKSQLDCAALGPPGVSGIAKNPARRGLAAQVTYTQDGRCASVERWSMLVIVPLHGLHYNRSKLATTLLDIECLWSIYRDHLGCAYVRISATAVI